MPRTTRPDISINAVGRLPVSRAVIADVVEAVLFGDGEKDARVSVTFNSSQQMRALNRATFGRDRSTDVISFPMRHDGRLAGDVYVCPARCRAQAEAHGVTQAEELVRVVIHGILHLLGYDHGAGEGRLRSAMWKRQESFVRKWLESAG